MSHAKISIAGALAYLILPVDAIPDVTPMVGYSDDVGALAIVIATFAEYIGEEHREQAREFLASLKDFDGCDEEIPDKIE